MCGASLFPTLSLSASFRIHFLLNFPLMSFHFVFQTTRNIPSAFRVIRRRHIPFSRPQPFAMEVKNSKPYENGFSDIGTESKWKSDERRTEGPRPVAVCGPSGSGKSTLLKRLLAEYRDYIEFSISHTTRNPRPNELPGIDYHFVSRPEFEAAVAKGEFLEHAEFSGNIYGTTKSAVTKIQKEGKLCILDVEMIGVKNLRRTSLNPKFVFVKTPTLQVLEDRLRHRNTESEESLQKRLARAKEELEYGEAPGNFDLIVVNDNLEEAYKQLKEFLLPDIESIRNGH